MNNPRMTKLGKNAIFYRNYFCSDIGYTLEMVFQIVALAIVSKRFDFSNSQDGYADRLSSIQKDEPKATSWCKFIMTDFHATLFLWSN